MQDLTSWSFNDHENGEESVQNYTGGSGQWSQGSWDHSHQEKIGNTLRREGLKSCSARNVPLLKKAHVQPVRSLPMIQRRPGWKCCGQMRPKSSSLASTQLTVFGGGGMLSMTTRTPSPPSNMEVETLCFGGVFLLEGQDNCTASKDGQWTGPCTVRARALKPVRALKMGHGWVFQHDNDPKQQRSGSRRSTLRSWSGLAHSKSVEGADGSSCPKSASKP